MQSNPAAQTTRTVPGFSLLARQGNTHLEPLQSILPDYYPDGSPIGGVLKALGEAERNRLVKAAKCPTQIEKLETARKQAEGEARFNKALGGLELKNYLLAPTLAAIDAMPAGAERTKLEKLHDAGIASRKREIYPDNHGEVASWNGTAVNLADLALTGEFSPEKRTAEGGDSAFTVISHREWSDEWRIRTQVDQCSAVPPQQDGDRITHTLSMGGASRIADSCAFMHLKNGGYRTFLTLTFDSAGRSRVEIRQAEGDFTEINTDKRGPLGAITAGVSVSGVAKREGVWSGTVKRAYPWGRVICHDENGMVAAVNQWNTRNQGNDQKINPDSPDGTFTPVQLIDGRYYASATGEAGADVTYHSIQKEIGRFFDAAHKMRQRGWKAQKNYPWGRVTCFEREGVAVGEKPSAVIGIKGALADKSCRVKLLPVRYCWVIENPLNERDQRNPHVHILMDWRVKFSAFASWADRLESIWGQGFATLEKIKDSEMAGAYMAKAAGYLSKAAGADDQGPVKGNRYGISALSRAPEWVTHERLELGIMGHLIADTHDYFSALYGGHFAKRKELNETLSAIPKEQKQARHKVGAVLGKVRRALNRLPAIASKYQILIKSTAHKEEFLNWATSDKTQPGNGWLPPKAAGDAWGEDAPKPAGNWLKEFQFRMHCERATRRFLGMPMEIYKACFQRESAREQERESTLNDWINYQLLGAAP